MRGGRNRERRRGREESGVAYNPEEFRQCSGWYKHCKWLGSFTERKPFGAWLSKIYLIRGKVCLWLWWFMLLTFLSNPHSGNFQLKSVLLWTCNLAYRAPTLSGPALLQRICGCVCLMQTSKCVELTFHTTLCKCHAWRKKNCLHQKNTPNALLEKCVELAQSFCITLAERRFKQWGRDRGQTDGSKALGLKALSDE